ATGFDAITGGFDRIEFLGVGGQTLKAKWAEGPRTYLGLQAAGFPNLVTLLSYMRARGKARAEAAVPAEAEWTAHVHETAARMLFTRVDSWMTGVHSAVKHARGRTAMVYAGGAPRFRERCEEVAAAGYAGFDLR